MFCDLRGFTAFAETAEPEEVMTFLANITPVSAIVSFGGTLERFSGDGIVVVFNDPLPCADPARRRRDGGRDARGASGLHREWRRRGREIGFGIGIAQGYATLGRSVSPSGSTTRLSARSETSRRGYALLPTMARSS